MKAPGPPPVRSGRLPGRRAPWPALGLLLVLPWLGNCGGGGGSDVEEPVEGPPPGIAGKAFLPESDLGRFTEQEPNGGRDLPYRLPPLPPRSSFEVAGMVGEDGSYFGLADDVDAFCLESLGAQDILLSLDYALADPLGGGDNDAELEVFDAVTGALLASDLDGAIPRTVAITLPPGGLADVVITARTGHAAYVLRCAASDPSVPLTAPAARLASRTVAMPTSESCAGTHVLVRLRDGQDEGALASRFGLRVGRRLGTGSLRLRLPSRIDGGRLLRIRAICDRLRQEAGVRWAEPDWYVRPQGGGDPGFSRQWNLQAVGAPAVWARTRGDSSIVIGVVDSGIVEHPDLVGRVEAGYDFVSDEELSIDGDGRDSDPTDPGAREAPSGLSEWHGTHVAAIAVANGDDGYGICGVAPGCRVMPLRALGVGGGLASDVADAILFAAGELTVRGGRRLAAPLPILNLSVGLSEDSTDIREACDRASTAGVLLLGAAGNTGQTVLYPARYATVVAISAVDADLDTTGYSNFGLEVELAAPGGNTGRDLAGDGWPDGVLSCVLDDTVYPAVPSHAYLVGTSQAVPHVAGAAALLLSLDPTLSAGDLKTLLTFSALDRGALGRDAVYGHGVLQIHEAVRLWLQNQGTPPPEPPQLHLLRRSVKFEGFQTQHEVPVMNVGGGRLELGAPTAVTDDGTNWLTVSVDPGTAVDNTNTLAILVHVDHAELPTTPGAYSGLVFVRDATTTLDTLRVTVHVGGRLQAGLDHALAVMDGTSGAVRAFGTASATHGYRYWFPMLAPGAYKIMAGQDLDGDGFFCEVGDACGWYGGVSEETAEVVQLLQSQTVYDRDVLLQP